MMRVALGSKEKLGNSIPSIQAMQDEIRPLNIYYFDNEIYATANNTWKNIFFQCFCYNSCYNQEDQGIRKDKAEQNNRIKC